MATAHGLVLPGNADLAFVEAVRDSRPACLDFGVVLRAHELGDAVYRSADADGAPVFLPDSSEGRGFPVRPSPPAKMDGCSSRSPTSPTRAADAS